MTTENSDSDTTRDVIAQARALQARSDIVSAKRVLEAFLEQHPDNISVMSQLADLFMANSEVGRALTLRLRVLELSPDNVDAIHEAFAISLLRDDEYDQIVEQLARRGLEIDPNHVDLLNGLANLSQLPGMGVSDEEALALYQRALRLAPEKWELLLDFARLLHERFGRSEEALPLIERCLELVPPQQDILRMEAAKVLADVRAAVRDN